MSINSAKISADEIKAALPRLSKWEIVELDKKIHDYLETSSFTKASEIAFSEWEDPEEDIYSADV